MLQENRQQPLLELVPSHPRLHLAGELMQAALARGDGQFVRKLAQHGERNAGLMD
jgi:hypothetical protein